MTPDVVDRAMPAWLQEHGAHRVAPHLDEVLAATARTRQRPWWSSPGRWLPMDLTLRQAPFVSSARTRALILAILAALVIAALIVVGVGTPHRLPPPFGLARNGVVDISLDGDLYRVDPLTGQRTPLLADPAFDFGAYFARDGTKVMFLRSTGKPVGSVAHLQLAVADADGRNVRLLTEPLVGLDWMDWSPDSTQIAFIAQVDGVDGILHVANVDGSGVQRLTTVRPVQFPAWLPPDGHEILYTTRRVAKTDPQPAIYGIRPDGTRRTARPWWRPTASMMVGS